MSRTRGSGPAPRTVAGSIAWGLLVGVGVVAGCVGSDPALPGTSQEDGGAAGDTAAPDAGTTCTPCEGECVDLMTSATNCGACGSACAGRELCVGGSCTCPSSERACNGACVDVQSSSDHCGECGRRCAAGTTCTGGTCCGDGERGCGGACVDVETSDTHCGSCDESCTGTTVCASANCKAATRVGNAAPFPQGGSFGQNFLIGSKVTLAAGATLAKFGVVTKAVGARMRFALYSDDADSPGQLLASSDPFTMAIGTQEIPAKAQISLAAGTYWLMFITDVSSASIGYENTGGEVWRYANRTFNGAFSDPFGPSALAAATTGKANTFLVVVD
ncbi:MAG: hypothetical protein KF850_09390 [Labilithrix sp.]|nr:hypothetical protein [Labilithrix sp.]